MRGLKLEVKKLRDSNRTRVKTQPGFPSSFLVLALKILHPGKLLSLGHADMNCHPKNSPAFVLPKPHLSHLGELRVT